MLSIKYSVIFCYLLLFLTFISVNEWSPLPLGNPATTFLLQSVIVYFIHEYKKEHYFLYGFRDYAIVYIWLAWLGICFFRGVLITENIVEAKQLMYGTSCLIIPYFTFLFADPKMTAEIFRFWYRYAMVFFLVAFLWLVGVSQFYLSPLLILFCFFPLFEGKKRLMVIVLALLYLALSGLDNRAQLAKGICSVLMGVVVLYKDYISYRMIRIAHFAAYFLSLLIFIYILSDAVSIIKGDKSVQESMEDYNSSNEESKDTRSLLYVDVILSAVQNNYILGGNTPARGNKITVSGPLFMWAYSDTTEFNKNERHWNELLHLNVFTWTGLIGLIIYSLIYIKASFMAVYKSNNVYIKLLGCYIAFRWSFGWIEDLNKFDILNVALWMMIALCMSVKYREMSDKEFKDWFNSIL